MRKGLYTEAVFARYLSFEFDGEELYPALLFHMPGGLPGVMLFRDDEGGKPEHYATLTADVENPPYVPGGYAYIDVHGCAPGLVEACIEAGIIDPDDYFGPAVSEGLSYPAAQILI